MEIYDIISALAKERKITIASIEREAGLANGSICKWNHVSPSVGNLKKVADALGVTVNDLIGQGA